MTRFTHISFGTNACNIIYSYDTEIVSTGLTVSYLISDMAILM